MSEEISPLDNVVNYIFNNDTNMSKACIKSILEIIITELQPQLGDAIERLNPLEFLELLALLIRHRELTETD